VNRSSCSQRSNHSQRPIKFAIWNLHFAICNSWVLCATLAVLVLSGGAAQTRGAILYAQASARPQLVPARLLAELRSKNSDIRTEAANQIGALRSRGALSSLIRLLSDSDGGVREAACYALGQIADPNAAPHLVHAMTDTNPEVRATAAFALGMVGERRSATALSNALEDAEPAVRCSAVMALGLMQDEEAIDEVVEMLNDPSFDVRFDAVWTLGQIGEPDVEDSLRSSLINLDMIRIDDSLKEAFRQSVQRSLEEIQERNILAPVVESDGSRSRPRRVAPATNIEDTPHRVTKRIAIRQSALPVPTERARQAHSHGSVGLRVLVGADGRPARVYVVRRGRHGLDQRAVQAAMQYRFDPSMIEGLPQTEWLDLDIRFER
jgi:TonB family protein